ncbi:MerR family transcriptional regulator [Paenibacillus soyae]|uniref:MerR family transcriptional regulator n=1 Tax=Paenibacillus soyae TaxID=2969249 RepID=A0A9X2SCK0_9BACL|nr:MerR family transcriptional regulator [Paenibacillus soyae]MCR2806152.1 MerR family transcriptional regulator [Paenibacillus soyae]
MKIKEVCRRSGLTERTIRYYVEEGLIAPVTTARNGRDYREYSEHDVEALNTIAGLRKLFFTIDEIKDMQKHPERIGEVLGAYKLKMAADVKAKAAIVEALDGLELRELRDIGMIAAKLRALSDKLELPPRDVNPNFGKFEAGTKADREREYELFLVRQAKQFKRGKIMVTAIASLNVLISLFSLIASGDFISFIIQTVLSICLFLGVSWVRYFFAVGAAFTAFISIQILVLGLMEPLIAIIGLVQLIYSVAICVLLFRSEAISEFLYSQKNG